MSNMMRSISFQTQPAIRAEFEDLPNVMNYDHSVMKFIHKYY